MAFQQGAFQADAFQTAIPEPPEPSVPSFAGPIEITFPRLERAGVAVLRIVATGSWRLRMTEQELRRRVRDYFADLVG